jgi:hypothetical protein
MLPIRLVLCFCVLMLAPAAFAQRPSDPKVEIYIPKGMPIQIEATRDEKEQSITKYNIKRIVGPEVDKVTIVNLIVGRDGKVSKETRFTTARVADPASIAWASSVDVRRLILIVEHIETDKGAWLIDSEDQHANLSAIVERGADALPRAKFIKKE